MKKYLNKIIGGVAGVLIVLIALFPVLTHAAVPAFIQGNSNSFSSGNTQNLTLPGSVVAGNTLIFDLSALSSPGITVSTVTDNQSNTWVKEKTNGDSTRDVELWRVKVAAGGSLTVTVTMSGSIAGGGVVQWQVIEYSNVANTALITSNSSLSAMGTSHDAGSVTIPDAQSYLVLSSCISTGAVSFTPDAGDLDSNNGNNRNYLQYRTTSASGTITPVWTTNISTRCFGIVVVFIGTSAPTVQNQGLLDVKGQVAVMGGQLSVGQ